MWFPKGWRCSTGSKSSAFQARWAFKPRFKAHRRYVRPGQENSGSVFCYVKKKSVYKHRERRTWHGGRSALWSDSSLQLLWVMLYEACHDAMVELCFYGLTTWWLDHFRALWQDDSCVHLSLLCACAGSFLRRSKWSTTGTPPWLV